MASTTNFGVNRTTLRNFYDTVVMSAIFYAVVCWCGGIIETDRGKLNKLVKRPISVLDCPLKLLEQVGEEMMLSKLKSITDNTSHPVTLTPTVYKGVLPQVILTGSCPTFQHCLAFYLSPVQLKYDLLKLLLCISHPNHVHLLTHFLSLSIL